MVLMKDIKDTIDTPKHRGISRTDPQEESKLMV